MRYEFGEHPDKPGWYLVTDTKWMFSCEFKEHEFNETQEFSGLDRLPADEAKAAGAMRELGEWIHSHHCHEAMPPSAFELRLSEDDTTMSVVRRKRPAVRVDFSPEEDVRDIAKVLRKCAEYLDKRIGRRHEQD